MNTGTVSYPKNIPFRLSGMDLNIISTTVSAALCVPVFLLVICFFPLRWTALPVMIGYGFIAALLCSVLSARVRSFRGENLYKTLFSGVCLVLLAAGGLLAGV